MYYFFSDTVYPIKIIRCVFFHRADLTLLERSISVSCLFQDDKYFEEEKSLTEIESKAAVYYIIKRNINVSYFSFIRLIAEHG